MLKNVNEEKLKENVNQSLFLTEKMKQELLDYFERLSEAQKLVVQQGIEAEKILLLDFLKHLRNKPEMKLSAIGEYYKKQQKSKRKQQEFEEEFQKQEELQNLLLDLENTY